MSKKPLSPTSENSCHAPTGKGEKNGEKNGEKIFTNEEVKNLLEFYETFKKIHTRLVGEGYEIRNGKIIPPQKSRH